jgi:hypothetical protein
MKKCTLRRAITGVFACLALSASPVLADTGPFTGPLQNSLLSVDLNGGPLSSAVAPTEGYNGSSSTPFYADQYGVTWSPWGGNTYSGGDGT